MVFEPLELKQSVLGGEGDGGRGSEWVEGGFTPLWLCSFLSGFSYISKVFMSGLNVSQSRINPTVLVPANVPYISSCAFQ